jgi:hypothetical protein
MASHEKLIEVLRLLLAKGADTEAKDKVIAVHAVHMGYGSGY